MKNLLIWIFIIFYTCLYSVWAIADIKIQISGVKGTARENVLVFLSIERYKTSSQVSTEQIFTLHKKATTEIKRALKPFGYYQPTVTSSLNKQADGWLADYTILLGPPIRIQTLDFKISGAAQQDPAFSRFVRSLPLKVGDILQHAVYEESKNRLQQMAAERGYFDAELTISQLRINVDKNIVDIVIHFKSGPRYLLGRVQFNQSYYDERFLSRFIPFKKGDPYTLTQLLDLQNALSDSDNFSHVEAKLQRSSDLSRELPVDVFLSLKKRTKYTFGIGFGTDTNGVRGSLGIERRRLNGRGHKLTANAKYSELGNSLSLNYIIPMKNPRTDQLIFTLGQEAEQIEERSDRKLSVSASHSRVNSGWQKTLFLNVEKDKYEISNISDESVLVMPGVTWTRIRANNRIYTTFGNRFLIDVRGGAETLGSTTSFLQLRLATKFIRGVKDFGRILLRGDVAASEMDVFDELPLSARFFAGGDISVRGYGYNSLGPEDSAGEVIGGKHLMVGSIEYEHLVSENWNAAIFYDVGNAMNSFSNKLKRGTGIGMRYKSPVGLVRLDIATALDKRGNPWRLHISIGPDL